MKYLLTAVLALAFVSPALAVEKNTSDRIGELREQVKQARMEIKALREHDRVEKATQRFCSTQESSNYLICEQGPWVETGKTNVNNKGNKR